MNIFANPLPLTSLAKYAIWFMFILLILELIDYLQNDYITIDIQLIMITINMSFKVSKIVSCILPYQNKHCDKVKVVVPIFDSVKKFLRQDA